MTKKEAKYLSIEIWEYLRDHPQISRKKNLPESLFSKIKDLENQCPLCAVVESCKECPLGEAIRSDSYFCTYHQQWSVTICEDTRVKAASEIIALIKAWEI